MTKLQELYREKEYWERSQAQSTAGAMMRRQKLNKLQQEINYYDREDNISREQIQEQLNEIDSLQEKIELLTVELADKKRQLSNYVFGEHISESFFKRGLR